MVHNQSQLFGYIVTLVLDRDDAEDIFQETCLALWKNRQECDLQRDFMPWACGFAKNKVREYFRQRQRCEKSFGDDLLEQLIDTRLALEDALDARAQALSECLGKLTQRQRQLVEKGYTARRTIKAVAEEMEIAPAALTMRLRRIRQLLFDCIGKVRAQQEV
jgi:RNA polymerase sigma-70 factor (ECF subfamily)